MMSTEHRTRVESLVHELLETSVDLRDDLLDQECKNDDDLRAEVLMLLEACEKSNDFLEVAPSPLDLHEEIPDHIGGYEILGLLGTGGMGIVYLAEQGEPIKRKIALKLIKPGMDSKSVLSRFEAERHALALMDHPCVATVFDGGLSEKGRPYFTMELVNGLPITEHCDKYLLEIDERIELFIRVCDAVQHAHGKGIIHRDIKPSNILVEYVDGESTPKVIDFGVAKALEDDLVEGSVLTQDGHFIGTPEYMSPEQAEMSSHGVDTRTDIYSLGIILYELLSGVKPFDSETLEQAGLAVIHKIIREVDPPKPSTRLKSLPATSNDSSVSSRITKSRKTNLRSLTNVLRHDLDWVVMRCLEKDRDRRYDTANALASELNRFLNNQPVIASRPSVYHQIGKFVRRNRAGAIAGAITFTFLVIATSVSIFFAIQTANERDKTLVAYEDLDTALISEMNRSKELETLLDFHQRRLADVDISEFGSTIKSKLKIKVHESGLRSDFRDEFIEQRLKAFDIIIGTADFSGMSIELFYEHIFQPEINYIETHFSDLPLLKAKLLQMSVNEMQKLGLIKQSIDPQKEVLSVRKSLSGIDDINTLTSMHNLGILLRDVGNIADAAPYFSEAYKHRKRILGEHHLDTLTSLNCLYFVSKETSLLKELDVDALNNASENHYSLLPLLGDQIAFAEMPSVIDKIDDLKILLFDCMETYGVDSENSLILINLIGKIYYNDKKFANASDYFSALLDTRREQLGNDHPKTLDATLQFGLNLIGLNKASEAENYCISALEGYTKLYGNEHPRTIESLKSMGILRASENRIDEAVSYFQRSLDLQIAVFGDGHNDTMIESVIFANFLNSNDLVKEAEYLFNRCSAAASQAQRDGYTYPIIAHSKLISGHFYENQNQPLLAEQLYLEALGFLRSLTRISAHSEMIVTLKLLAQLTDNQSRYSESELYYQELLELLYVDLPPNHDDIASVKLLLALNMQEQGKFDEAEPFLYELLSRSRQDSRYYPDTLSMLQSIVFFYVKQSIFSKTEPFLLEELEILHTTLGNNDDKYIERVAFLSYVFVEQSKFAEAEPYCLQALEFYRSNRRNSHEDTLNMIKRLTYVLVKQGKFAEATPYSFELLDSYRVKFGNDHENTLHQIWSVGTLLKRQDMFAEAESFQLELLESYRRKRADYHEDTLLAITDLSATLFYQDKYTEAEPYYLELLESNRRILGNDHEDTLSALNMMCLTLHSQGKYAEAESYYSELLESNRRILGNDHKNTLLAVGSLGMNLIRQGKYATAEPYYLELLESNRRILGNDHEDTLSALNMVCFTFHQQDKYAEAESYSLELLESNRRILGNDHEDTLSALNMMCFTLHNQGKYAEAESYYSELLESYRSKLGNDHEETLLVMKMMCLTLHSQGKYAEAEPYYLELLESNRRLLGNDHKNTLLAVGSLGMNLSRQGKYATAEPYYLELLESNRRLQANDPEIMTLSLSNLSYVLMKQGKYTEAEELLSDAIILNRKLPSNDNPDFATFLVQSGKILIKQGRNLQAYPILIEALAIRQRVYSPNDWRTLNAQSLLGGTLIYQLKFEEAETLLIEAAEEIKPPESLGKKLQTTITGDAIQRVIDLYTEWGIKEPESKHEIQANLWREKLKKLHQP